MLANTGVVAKPSLTLKRRLNAAPEKVYAAWAQPAKLMQWFGPDSGAVTRAELDLRVGGRYTIVFHTEDGEEHHVSGVYREVVPNEKLVFTWAWRSTPERESLVTVLIKPDGDASLELGSGRAESRASQVPRQLRRSEGQPAREPYRLRNSR